MTQAEVKIFETDVVVFPAGAEKELSEKGIETENVEVVEIKERTLKIDLSKRFARLKKTIRKRSVNIL